MLIPDLLSKLVHEFENNGGISESFKLMGVTQLEEAVINLQALYSFGNYKEMRPDLINESDWNAFINLYKADQALFLAYLSAKIAVLREAESNDTV